MNNIRIIPLIKKMLLLVITAMLLPITACASNSDDPPIKPSEPEEKPHIVVNIPSADKASDMVLIYHGYTSRPSYVASEMKSYIYRENNGTVEWLFDGFLFLEIYGNLNGTEYDYGIASYHRIAPGKSEWDYLINKTFEKGKGPDAIEETIDSLVQLGIKPSYKRKAMFCIPNPQVQCTNWGILNHKTLDFKKTADRFEAAKWYIDRIIDEFEKKDYNYVDLAGFYWLHEQIDLENKDDQLIGMVQAYLKEKGLPLTWIPYYGAQGADRWKELGFDIAYQQPNYFFSLESPMSIINNAINFAMMHQMSLEMEFDDRITQAAYRERFYTYLTEFEKSGAWDYFPIAYYEGGGAWLRMSQSKDAEVKKAFKALGDILVRRNGKFSKIVNK